MDAWISPNGIWKIHRPAGWLIENLKTGFGDRPIVYGGGMVAFDYPEIVPGYVKDRFREMAGDEQRTIKTLHDMAVRQEALIKFYERSIGYFEGDPLERLLFIQCFAALDVSEGHGLAGIYTEEFNKTLILYQEAEEQ